MILRNKACRTSPYPTDIMKVKKAFITGITGQDGSYLAELLLSKGYAVRGLVRRASAFNRTRIDHLRTDENIESGRLKLHDGELSDFTSFHRLMHKVEPDEIYHLAGQSHVGLSFEIPEITCLENGMATLHLLESLRELGKTTKLYIAGSSEIFGSPATIPQDESTPFKPSNPYGCAKEFATNLGRVYRESHGLFVSVGIAYNHESPRRGKNFVTKKISMGAVRHAKGDTPPLQLGNLAGSRDWGFAGEYVVAMWEMLQAEMAAEYILATGESCSVRDFARAAFDAVGVSIEFEGEGTKEIARRTDNGKTVITVNPDFFRPVDTNHLVGNPTRAKRDLGWTAQTKGCELAGLMANYDLAQIHWACFFPDRRSLDGLFKKPLSSTTHAFTL